MKPRWRLIETGPLDPFSNMAFDETLLRSYSIGSSIPTLRIYGWKTPAISLGYSQDPGLELDLGACRARGISYVRRMTGGGMILHSNELTYSLVCSKADLGIAPKIVSSYKIICSFLISFYKKLGFDAGFACDVIKREKLGQANTLCFASKEKYDIVIGGKKIGGNAQKRSGDVIFQHGSIPLIAGAEDIRSLLRNKEHINLRGTASMEELSCLKVGTKALSKILIKSFEESFDVELAGGKLSRTEEDMFADLKISKYEKREWNLERIEKALQQAPVG